MTQENNVLLRTEKLCKSFGSTKANVDIDFTLRRGEIHGLVGENGSGKSTFLSQVAGIIPSDSGTIYLNDELYSPQTPLDAYANKIGTVVQELGIIGSLPGTMNVFMGQEKRFTTAGFVSIKKMNAEVKKIQDKWDLNGVELGMIGSGLNVESRKQIELLRALAVDPDILILDEITQALSYDNRLKLYGLINKFKEMGRSVLVISHDLDEIVEISDRLTILRDGKVVETVESKEITMDELKRKMVGRKIEGDYYRSDMEPSRGTEVVLSVRNLTVREEVKDLSFDLYEGEIIGFCGLSDSGIHTIGRALYGIEKDVSGTVTLAQKNISIKNSHTALKENMAYVPKERDGEGLMMMASIRENFCLPSTEELAQGKLGVITDKALNKTALDDVAEFAVKCKGIFQEISSLSGGNKQKVNLGRWVAKDLAVLVLDCPTRGVDVGAKAYLYSLIKDLKAKGLGMILISDELLEVIGIADRIFVFKNGEIKQEIERGPQITEEKIIEVMI